MADASIARRIRIDFQRPAINAALEAPVTYVPPSELVPSEQNAAMKELAMAGGRFEVELRSLGRLFAEIRALSRATQQAMPAEVYLVPEMNAWVAQRGGVMGFGSRRVMGVGLTLLQSLTMQFTLQSLAKLTF